MKRLRLHEYHEYKKRLLRELGKLGYPTSLLENTRENIAFLPIGEGEIGYYAVDDEALETIGETIAQLLEDEKEVSIVNPLKKRGVVETAMYLDSPFFYYLSKTLPRLPGDIVAQYMYVLYNCARSRSGYRTYCSFYLNVLGGRYTSMKAIVSKIALRYKRRIKHYELAYLGFKLHYYVVL